MTLHNNKGFSLGEVLIAIFIITVGITGAVSLINRSISSVALGKSQVVAASLAKEGIEIIRNIRDTNWLEGDSWNDGLGDGDDDGRVQYDSLELLSLSGNPALKIDANGVYQYSNGINTLFSRKITISAISAYETKVISEVTWSEKGRSHTMSAENRLYDWK